MLTGRCLCGGVQYQVSGAPVGMYHCHCAQCRRASGSSFATNVMVPSAQFELIAGADLLSRFESSPGKHRHFCSRCGSPIFSRSQATEQLTSVRCGTLDGDPGLRPGVHFYVASKSPWYDICDDIPQKAEGLTPTR